MKRKTSMSDSIGTFAYTYDSLGRRTQRIDDSSITNLFGYNLRSELVSAEMGTNSYSYAYDPIGNRTETVENGLTTTYAANELNQYTALNPASTNPTPFTYDPDGNMTSDGTWSYSWDAENRLIEVQPLVTNLDSSLVQFMYDAQSRRIARREFAWMAFLHDDPAWRYVQGRAYRYDDWNLLHELKPPATPRTPHPYISQTNLALTGIGGPVAAFYLWGLDLSTTLQGAGGVGGLLQTTRNGTNVFSFYDANGNIIGTADGGGAVCEMYKYDCFGNETGLQPMDLATSPFHFSTKFFELEIHAYDYGYRHYFPALGRWISRDPLAEYGFVTYAKNGVSCSFLKQYRMLAYQTPYVFVGNRPKDTYDILGLDNPGCDLPKTLNPALGEIGGKSDCYRRCCAAHDECYFKHGCSQASWGYNLAGIAAEIAGCKFCSIFINGVSPCARCNSAVVACFARCCTGVAPPKNDRWFCPNGPTKGRYYDVWDDIPGSCWESGEKP